MHLPISCRTATALLLLSVADCGQASLAGFPYLQIQPDARVASTAASTVAGVSGVGGLQLNPASVAGLGDNQAQFLWLDHLQDINYFNTSISLKRYAPWILSAGFSHLGYGSLDGRDEFGVSTGSFESQDNLVFVGAARELGAVRAGANLKLGWSTIDDARASLLAMDLGLQSRVGKDFLLGAALRNAGKVLSDFGSSETPLPVTLQLGVQKSLEHLPFTWSLAWEQVKGQDSNMTVGGEFLVARRWHLGLGYNFGLGEDRLSAVSGESTRGLSAGLGGRIMEDYHFHWAWNSFGELGALNRFTISRTFP